MDYDQNRISGREPGLKREHGQTNGPVLGGEHRLLHAIEHLQDKNSKIRERAIAVLDEFGDEQIVKRLAVALYDRNEKIRERAGEALGKIGGEQAQKILLETVQNESLDISIRCAAVSGLGYYADDSAIDLLFDYLGHENTTFHGYVRNALIKFGETVVPSLQTTLQSENIHQRANALKSLTIIYLKRFLDSKSIDLAVVAEHYRYIQAFAADEEHLVLRRAALWSAMQMIDPALIELFAEHLSDEDDLIKQYAVTGLARIGKRFLHDPQRKDQIFNTLFEAIPHDNYWAQRSNYRAFLEMGVDVIPILVERFLRGPREEQYKIFRIIQMFDQTLVDQLDNILDSLDNNGKRMIVEALHGQYRIEGKVKLVQREERWVRLLALDSLAQTNNYYDKYLAVRPLLDIAQAGTDTEAMCKVLKALGHTGQRYQHISYAARLEADQHHSRLITLLQTQAASLNPKVRIASLRALGSLQDPDLASFLINHLQICLAEQRYYEAAAAAKSLAASADDPQVIQILLQAFEASSHTLLRRSCLTALSSTSTPDAIPGLIALLDKTDHNERVHLIRALYLIGSRVEDEASIQLIVSTLENLLDETNPNILTHVIRGLGSLQAICIIPRLTSLLDSKYSDVQSEAANVMADMTDEQVIPVALAALHHENPRIKSHAISACRRLEIRAAIPHLMEAARHGNISAIQALGAFPEDDDVIQLLADLVIHAAEWPQRQATHTLHWY